MKLSRRLEAAASLVRRGSFAADVGCDHGKLAAALAQRGICPRVLASDLRPGPLTGARALVERLGLGDRVQLALADGLCGAPPELVDDVIIAGLGAEETARIILGAPWLKHPDKRLVLVPASRHGLLRELLAREGYEILKEIPVQEAGQLYTVMSARYCARPRELTSRERELGLIDPSLPEGRSYWLRVLGRCRRIEAGLLQAAREDPELLRRQRELARYIEGELEEHGN